MEKQGAGQLGAASPPFSSSTASPMATAGLRHACPTYKKFHLPLMIYPWASLSFLLEGVFFWAPSLSLLCHNWSSPFFCLSPPATVTTLITVEIKLGSVPRRAQSAASSADGPGWQSLRRAQGAGVVKWDAWDVWKWEYRAYDLLFWLTGDNRRKKWSPKSSRISSGTILLSLKLIVRLAINLTQGDFCTDRHFSATGENCSAVFWRRKTP